MALLVSAIACLPILVLGLFYIKMKAKQREDNEREYLLLLNQLKSVNYKPNAGIYLRLGDIEAARPNLSDAINYYKAAVDLHSTAACKKLSAIYYGQLNYEQYFKIELKAAELGVELSMRIVSNLYKSGHGVLKNIGNSTYWLLRSAEAGNSDSMVKIADAYLKGFGVQENPMEALAWLYVAEYKKNLEAVKLIKEAEAKLSNALVLEAQDRAKILLDSIAQYRFTSQSTFSVSSNSTIPSQLIGAKPKHSPRGSGSGAIISSAGHIATAAHVIKGASYLEVITATGVYTATILNSDEQNDCALLKINGTFDTHIPVARSSDVRLGQSVATIGYPNIGIQGDSPKVTQGVISAENGIQNDIRMWQISVPIQPGNSGGPLLDERGRLVGIVIASLSLKAIQITKSVPQNVNYAIKSAYLEPLLNFHKLGVDNTQGVVPVSFQDMVATAQKAAVLVLVY